MIPTAATCYTDPADKRRKFAAVVIPGIFDEAARGAWDPDLQDWLQAAGVLDSPRGLTQLAALHAAARAGLYVSPRPANCDPPQPVAITLAQGGDCDQWAAVILAALRRLGYSAKLLTFGNRLDPFQHVAPAALWRGRIVALDAKGDQGGLPFGDIDPSYPAVDAYDPAGWYW